MHPEWVSQQNQQNRQRTEFSKKVNRVLFKFSAEQNEQSEQSFINASNELCIWKYFKEIWKRLKIF